MKVELAAIVLTTFSIFLAAFLIRGTNKEQVEDSSRAVDELAEVGKIVHRNILIEMEKRLFDGIISTDRFTFPHALKFCEDNGKRMPADYFKIKNNEFKEYPDLGVWVNASLDVTKNVSYGLPKMQEKFEQIMLKIFDEPLWVLQNYDGEHMRKNSLFFTLPGEHYWDFVRFICDDDRVDDQSGEIKIRTA